MISKPLKTINRSTQSGFTIIESLVAILVVTILLTAIAPVLALSVANRVQARRVDIAASAAKSYIDGLRSGAIADHPPIISDPADLPSAPDSDAIECSNLSNPAIGYCDNPPSSSNYLLFCIDGDGSGVCADDPKDMVIQAYGYQAIPISGIPINDPEKGYDLRIRIYRSDAFKSEGRTLVTSEDLGGPQAAFTGGLGLSSSQAPLFETSTQIVTSETTYGDLCEIFRGCN